ncbi:MAG: hypothetical protein HOV80_06785 [Polyangiaceae bacterium]|nr:hypothetical protein [Polyangiaceae bacterium]
MRRRLGLGLALFVALTGCDDSEGTTASTTTGTGGAGGAATTLASSTSTGSDPRPHPGKNAAGLNAGSCPGGPGTCALHVWSKRFGDASPQYGETLATDADGNVLFAGYFQGNMDLGGGTLASPGGFDVFLAKYDPSGRHLWSKRAGDSSDQACATVAVGGDGSVLITGHMAGNANFGGEQPLTSAGSSDVFLAKYDASGAFLWNKRFGDGLGQWGSGLAVDLDDNIVLEGGFTGDLDFGGGAISSIGPNDAFVAKLDADGEHLWTRQLGGTGSATTYNLVTDPSGAVLVVGWFSGTMDFGGGARTSAGNTDVFIVKLDADGQYLWDQQYGDANAQESEGIAVDGDGNVLLAGYFRGTIDLGGEVLTSAGDYDVYIAKLDPDGNHLWSFRFGDDGMQAASRIVVDAFGDVLLTGHMTGSIDFGGGSLVGAGSLDIFVAKLDAEGGHIWSAIFGEAENQTAQTITTDPYGNVFLTGYIQGTADFGGDPLMSAGSSDAFLVKLGP